MVHIDRTSRHGDSGAIAIIAAAAALVMFALAALVVDLGLTRDTRRQAQNTADAASLAAANALYAESRSTPDFDAAVDAAMNYANENYGTTDSDWAACSTDDQLSYTPVGVSDCISFDDPTAPENALVHVPLKDQPVLFGGLVGYQGSSVGALAQARVDENHVPLCVFCVLNDDDPHNVQNGDLDVRGGDVRINGDLEVGPNGLVDSTAVAGSGGGVYVSGDVDAHDDMDVNGGSFDEGAPQVADPLANVPLPFSTQSSLTAKTNPCTQGPGLYNSRRISGTCTLLPGLYVFTGELTLNGGDRIIANGVTMYFTCGTASSPQACDPGEVGGTIKGAGNSNFTIAAPTATTVPAQPEELFGFAIVFDRNNDAAFWLVGTTGSTSIKGTIYGANALYDARGLGCTTGSTTMVVVGELAMDGTNSCFRTTYDASTNAETTRFEMSLVR